MSPAKIILERIGIQPAERALVGWAGLCLVLMGAAAFALLNTAETLFLKRVGVDALPLALLASSALLVVNESAARQSGCWTWWTASCRPSNRAVPPAPGAAELRWRSRRRIGSPRGLPRDEGAGR